MLQAEFVAGFGCRGIRGFRVLVRTGALTEATTATGTTAPSNARIAAVSLEHGLNVFLGEFHVRSP